MSRAVTRHRGSRGTAIVLAGGLGTRMHPLSADRPKHLLEVAGEPVVVHQLRWLAAHGVVDVVLATSHLGEQFGPVLGDGSRWGIRLTYSHEPTPAGTAGGLRLAAAALTSLPEYLVVVNGDLLTSHDLTQQRLMASPESRPDAVLHLRTVPDARAFGSVVADGHGLVTRFVEKSPNPPSTEVNAGTYVLRRNVLARIGDGVVSLERDVLPSLVDSGRVVAYRENALWDDVGTPQALVKASVALVRASGRDVHVDRSAVVDPTAVITDGSAVGPGTVVRAGARIQGSVIMSGAVIGPGADVTHSAVAPGARVAAGTVLRGFVS
ncbi:NDP-sugar synthase [Ornithinibacter aureus]|uniref:NDP-sugar synthase n=1 Tax=Ornithinibacter aureus TaxID=622664 RepID=A0ABP8JC52_9MICO|nr:mannose-1-phosphate guanylyltransferase [Ornithinibacter aureus]